MPISFGVFYNKTSKLCQYVKTKITTKKLRLHYALHNQSRHRMLNVECGEMYKHEK